MTNVQDELQNIFGYRLKNNEPLAKHVNFRIGGPATWFAQVESVDELKAVCTLAKETNTNIFVLGGGSNTLVSDEGFQGIVLKLAMRNLQIEETTVVAEAGVISAVMARKTAAAGLRGFAWAVSLPGTIGGAVHGNAGCFGGEAKDYIVSVDVLRDCEVVTLTKDELYFGYRDSIIKHSDDIVIRATFSFESGDPEVLKQVLAETLEKRKDSQPMTPGTAGCMFKNYEFKEIADIAKLQADTDIPESMIANKKISAGWLIDQMGFKGKKVGDAKVSEEHGNFLINIGNATASEVIQLISIIKMAARDRFGIQLEEEVQYIGF